MLLTISKKNRFLFLGLYFLLIHLDSADPVLAPQPADAPVFTEAPHLKQVSQSYMEKNSEELARHVQTYLTSSTTPISDLYVEPLLYNDVLDFLVQKTGSTTITETILFFAEKEALPIETVFSLVFVESGFDPTARNFNKKSSDLGLFQLNSRTFRHVAAEDLFHLETNVKLGTRYLRYAFNLMNDTNNALAVYNAGPSRPLRGNIPESTKNYVRKVTRYTDKLVQDFVQYMYAKFSISEVL